MGLEYMFIADFENNILIEHNRDKKKELKKLKKES